jgi:protein tyrosine/serine phosphatase
VKTIINLRGSNPGGPRYDAELAEDKLEVAHIDFRMSARRQLTLAHADTLIAVIRAAAKPILIHCDAGADRTGLASALYLAAIEPASEETSEEQLPIRFGHISTPFILE